MRKSKSQVVELRRIIKNLIFEKLDALEVLYTRDGDSWKKWLSRYQLLTMDTRDDPLYTLHLLEPVFEVDGAFFSGHFLLFNSEVNLRM